MVERVIQTSFAAGELAPSLFSRVDLEKYRSGMALGRNFYVDYRGGTTTRQGTQFITLAKQGINGQPKLIPFSISTVTSYVLIFGQNYIWFLNDGAVVIDPMTSLPLEVASPYAAADLPLLKYVQSASVLTLTHPNYPVYNLTQTGPTAFSLAEDVIGPWSSGPTGVNVIAHGNTAALYLYGYVVTAVDGNGNESGPCNPSFVGTDILDQDTGIINVLRIDTLSGAVYYKIYKVGPTPAATSPVPTVFGYIGSSVAAVFTDNNIAPDYSQTPPSFQDPFSPGQISQVQVTGPGAGSYGGYTLVALIFTGDGVDAKGFGVVDPVTNGVVGVMLINPGKGYTVCTVTDTVGVATYSVTLGQQSGTYPFAAGYFQQRRLFGGTTNFPESFVASQPGEYDNFNTNPIQLDSDAITASIASRQVNAIKSFTAMPTGLIILTTGGGFLISGGGSNAAITPSNIVAFPQASSGCNDLPPLVVNYDVLYAQNRGAVVRDLAFNFYVQSYTGTDRSVLASHLFTGFELNEWTYAEEPFRQILVVRNDGVMLSFTYVPEQEIFGWTHYDTNGLFCSVASIPEGQTNAVYVIVQRFVGNVWTYFVERFATGLYNTVEDSWCLDAALSTPNNYPSAGLFLTAATGTGVTAVADMGIFSSGDVGKTIWGNSGKANVVSFVNSTTVTVDILQPFDVVSDDPTDTPLPLVAGTWIFNPNVTEVSGLDYLDGLAVSVVADGIPIAAQIVSGGTLTIPSASRVTAGLGYQCQLQTLKLDLGDPTVQGKRKMIAAVTARVNKALALSVGPDFNSLVKMKELIPSAYPPVLISIDARTTIQGYWSKDGQVCFQQDLPLPATILGVIPEVVVGDTGK